jgi:hypothetical protein
MLLSLPLPAIVRSATEQSQLTLAPWELLLLPDEHPACVARLQYKVHGSPFLSRACMSSAADGFGEPLAPRVAGVAAPDADGPLREVWSALASQLTPLDTSSGGGGEGGRGRFSFVELASGTGSLSLLVARAFPNATVLSIEGEEAATDAHLAATLRGGLANNLIARSAVDGELVRRIYDSPELFRFQTWSGDLTALLMAAGGGSGDAVLNPAPWSWPAAGAAVPGAAGDLKPVQAFLGTLSALAATTFLNVPSAPLLSLAFTAFHDSHPSPAYVTAPAHEYAATRLPQVVEALALEEGAANGDGAGAATGSAAAVGAHTLPGTRYSLPLLADRWLHLHSHAGAACPSLWPLLAPAPPSGSSSEDSNAVFCAGAGEGAEGIPLGGLTSTAHWLAALASAPGSVPAAGAARDLLGRLRTRFQLAHHPRPMFVDAETRLLSALVRAPSSGEDSAIEMVVASVPALRFLPASVDDVTPAATPLTQLSLAAVAGSFAASAPVPALPASFLQPNPAHPLLALPSPESSLVSSTPWVGSRVAARRFVPSGLVRLDIRRLVRHVNHHFRSDIDGHTRKYTLHVQANVTAGAVLSRLMAQRGLPDTIALHAAVAAGATGSAVSGVGAGASPLGIADVYAALAPGCHPNHGHASAGDAGLIIAAAAAVVAEEEEAAAEREAREGRGKRTGKGKKPAAPSGGGGSGPAKQLPPFPVVSEQVSHGMALLAKRQGHGVGPRAFAASLGDQLPGVTSIILRRDMDGAAIPYDSVQGITLISLLRLNLLPPLRMRAYHQFVALPLYLDMAPWNIVALGPQLSYIDFDTRDRTFDAGVAQAYQVMEVLFNYKRTLEDFKACKGKGSNPYGFPFVSECVGGGSFSGPCSDSRAPVPCGDGTCHSDYVSCLRSISAQERLAEGRKSLRWAFSEYASASFERSQQRGDSPAAADGVGEGEIAAGAASRGSDRGRPLNAGEAHRLARNFLGLGKEASAADARGDGDDSDEADADAAGIRSGGNGQRLRRKPLHGPFLEPAGLRYGADAE